MTEVIKRTPKFYSLMYIDKDEKRRLHGKTRTSDERIDIFMKNAALLDKSLRWHGNDGLTMLTNDAAALDASCRRIGYDVRSVEIPFTLQVPKDIPFFSAHFKIDAFRYFGTRPDDEYSILMDNDVVQLHAWPAAMGEVMNEGIPTCYHLTLTGKIDAAQADCRRALHGLPIVQWTGGEYWGGVNSWYSVIYDRCAKIAPAYFKSIRVGQYHIGDEMLTTMALAQMRHSGVEYMDVGLMSIVKRYWGMHENKSLAEIDPVFAHLPADKVWTASLDLDKISSPADFLKLYQRHWRFYRMLNRLKQMIKK